MTHRESTQGEQENRLDAELLRRQLRGELHRARVEAGLTQKAAAEMLDWSVSKVVRIEQGVVPVAPSDVRVMLSLFGIDKEEVVDVLMALARDARKPGGWGQYEDIVSQPFKLLIVEESSAAHVWKYEPSVVPGYFQTDSYARALLTALGYSGRDFNRRLEIRSKRQEAIEASPGELHVIIGETALVRTVGNDGEMREQIRYLRSKGEEPKIDLYLLPFSAGAHPGMGGAFTVTQFDDKTLTDSLYLQDAELRSTSLDRAEQIQHYLNLFAELQGRATKTGAFSEHMDRIMREHYPSLHS